LRVSARYATSFMLFTAAFNSRSLLGSECRTKAISQVVHSRMCRQAFLMQIRCPMSLIAARLPRLSIKHHCFKISYDLKSNPPLQIRNARLCPTEEHRCITHHFPENSCCGRTFQATDKPAQRHVCRHICRERHCNMPALSHLAM
jgi:hypothetical protein